MATDILTLKNGDKLTVKRQRYEVQTDAEVPATLILQDEKKQTTRLLKAYCPTCTDESGKLHYTVRISAYWADKLGAWCPGCEKPLTIERNGGEGGDWKPRLDENHDLHG